ncbi:MAG: hypothetical protein ACREOF_08180 [Gemmatimonadales bacterium]
MSLRKALAIGVITAVLGIQASVIIPPGWPARSRYWPFVDYPMYSNAHPRDAVFSEYELAVRDCTSDSAFPVLAADLHLEPFVYWRLLETATAQPRWRRQLPPPPDEVLAAKQTLSGLVLQRHPQACQLQVWVRAYGLADLPQGGGPVFATVGAWEPSVADSIPAPNERDGVR